MVLKSRKNIPFISILSCLLLATFLTPVSAGFIPFLSNKSKLTPEQYSIREDQVNSYNKQAAELFEAGHFEEAQKLWEKAIETMENIEINEGGHEYDELNKSLNSVDEEYLFNIPGSVNEIDEMYEAAVSLFKKQRYVASKKMFRQIEAQTPDYKATRNYLTILKHKIKQTQQTLNEDKIKANLYSRQAERDEWERILEESEQKLKNKVNQQVEVLYEEALKNYKIRRFAIAKDYLIEIDSIVPGYKDTAKYLFRIDADIEKEKQRIAKEENEKKILARKQAHEEWERILKESEQKLQAKMKEQAEPIYQEALDYYKQREFELAKNHFQEVQMILPNYKSVSKYLTRINQDILKEAQRRQEQEARELARQQKVRDIARKQEEQRLAQLRAEEDKLNLQRFKDEVATRRLERNEWLKVLEEAEKERQNKLSEQAEFVYGEAIESYKKRRFKQAKEDFLEVEQIIPSYKSTIEYLARIDQDIKEEEHQKRMSEQRLAQRKLREEQYVELQRKEKQQKLRAAEEQKRSEEFEEMARIRKQKRDEWDKILKKAELQRDEKLKNEAEYIYQQALSAYKNKEWDKAKSGFFEAGDIFPGYKNTEKYLTLIDRNIQKEHERIQKEIAAANEKKRREEELVRKREEDLQRKLQIADQKREDEYKRTQTDIAYRSGLSLYKRQKYVEAKAKLLEADELVSGYKSTRRYLSRIDNDIQKALELDRRDQELVLREKQLTHEKEVEKILQLEREKQLKELKKEAQIRQEERKEWEKTIAQVERENKKRLQQQAESIYQEAHRYYRGGWYKQAHERFSEVETIMPGYRSAKKYSTLASQKIKQEDDLRLQSEKKIQDQMKEKIVSDSEDHQRAEAWRKKLANHEQEKQQQDQQRHHLIENALMKEEHGYQQQISQDIPIEVNVQYQPAQKSHTKDQEKIIRNRREQLKKQRHKMSKEYEKQFSQLYNRAVQLYRAGSYEESKEILLQIERMKPGYKRAASYIKKINLNIAKGLREKVQTDMARFGENKTRAKIIGAALDAFE